MKQWEIHYQSIVNVRAKYSEKEYRLPKEFRDEVPGLKIYQKYKDSFHLLTQEPAVVPKAQQSAAVVLTLTEVTQAEHSITVAQTETVTSEAEQMESIPALIVVPKTEESAAESPTLTKVN